MKMKVFTCCVDLNCEINFVQLVLYCGVNSRICFNVAVMMKYNHDSL